MPLSPLLSVASQNFNMNSGFLKQGLADLKEEDWCKRPNQECNSIQWIVGHVTWARAMVLARLGDKWKLPWMDLYARGAKCVDSPDAPTPKTLMEAWDESGTRLNQAMDNAPEELLNSPAPQPGPPSADGKMTGMINFMALHETYHVGQAAYIRSWLGKHGVMG